MHGIISTLRRSVTRGESFDDENNNCGRMMSSGCFKDGGDLPEWLLTEVLCRLPLESVFRFKCVSKQWLSLITDPCFSRFYISRASSQPPSWAILSDEIRVDGSQTPATYSGLKPHPWAILFDDASQTSATYYSGLKPLENMYSDEIRCPNYHVLPLPVGCAYRCADHSSTTHYYNILAVSCDGLVLYGCVGLVPHAAYIYRHNIIRYYICNPATKQWFGLSLPQYHTLPSLYGFLTRGWRRRSSNELYNRATLSYPW